MDGVGVGFEEGSVEKGWEARVRLREVIVE